MSTEIVIPTVGESVTNGVIAAWLVPEGSYVKRDDPVLELETDKITMEVPAPAAGVVSHAAAEGDVVDVGAVVGAIDESAEAPASAPAESSTSAEAASNASEAPPAETQAATSAPAIQPETNGHDQARATPLARKLASELGVDLNRVDGTGAGGRIREQDVQQAHQSGSTPAPAQAPSPASQPAFAGERDVERTPMSPLRQRVAVRLVEAQQTAAMLTTFNECDMTAVMQLRSRYKEAFAEKHGINLGFMSFFVKAVVGALQAYPLVNAFIVDGEDGRPAIEKHNYCDVAIAVASPKGLVVPVIRNAQTLNFAQIESTIKDYGKRASEGKLSLDEMTGGTFTITNGGVFGSLMSTPILNPPQSAILGMHTIKKRAMEDPDNPGQLALRPMMYLALSYDHRIIDGAEAVRFLVAIKDAIEDPQRLLLDL